MGNYNYNFFQIPASGPVGGGAVGNQQTRDADSKVSNFGALNYGTRSTDDYTTFVKSFKSKDEWQNPVVEEQRPSGFGDWTGADNNPYSAGSTVKKIRNDELVVMMLKSRDAKSPEYPSFDIMDTNVSLDTTVSGVTYVTASGITVSGTGMSLYYPNEGYKPFGGRTGGPLGYMA